MDVSAYAVLFLPDYQSYLAVRLEPYQTINNMTSCLLQLLSPDNIVLLVKPGF
jgi:hypothetical protein